MWEVIKLPIGCDLSLKALQLALEIGQEKVLGHPVALVVGPENWFIARELLYIPESATTQKESRLSLEKTRSMPLNHWRIEFTKGEVRSEAP